MLYTFAEYALDSGLNQLIANTYWLWPVLEILHFMGLSLLLGGLLVIDLRVAGHFRGFHPRGVHQLLPLVVTGLALNVTTGVLFFFGDPMRYAVNIGFQIKMGLVLLAGLNVLFYYLKIDPQVRTWDGDTPSPTLAKAVAYTSLIAWFGVLLCGRLIPYVGSG
ncbi:MAG: hypothetical protein RLZZ385_120 [Pseudomonadota bacterium]|jgi:hypothetical protein